MIFVTGCARSGTSLITKILKHLGVYLGVDNRINSLYENVSIRENVLKPYLIQCNADPLGQSDFPDTDKLPASYMDIREEIVHYLIGHEPCGYKDAKLTFVWPIFDAAFPDAKWILVRRDRDKIIDSCMRTTFMFKRKTREQWSWWVDEHEKRFKKMNESLDIIEICSDSVIENPQSFATVADHCGLEFKFDVVERAIDRKRWHGCKTQLSVAVQAPRVAKN